MKEVKKVKKAPKIAVLVTRKGGLRRKRKGEKSERSRQKASQKIEDVCGNNTYFTYFTYFPTPRFSLRTRMRACEIWPDPAGYHFLILCDNSACQNCHSRLAARPILHPNSHVACWHSSPAFHTPPHVVRWRARRHKFEAFLSSRGCKIGPARRAKRHTSAKIDIKASRMRQVASRFEGEVYVSPQENLRL